MAARMAEAARDRAISLTPVINQWPDAIGVASTATIVSHYARRGDYRVHAATCTGDEAGVTTYTHTFIKGARERSGEDAACALLTLRALAEAAGLENAPALAACGLRTEDTPAKNAVAPAAHDLIACVLAHWESGDGIAALSEFAAAGGRLVVARGTDTIGTEMELAVVDSVGELPRELRSTFTFVSEHFHDGRVSGLCDGSPSTEGVGGEYTGGWDTSEGRPEGRGVMRWANGISYDGLWSAGKYDGHGIKSYSKGGGYSGMWREGKRHGFGTSLYDGKWGYARWVGPFEDDKPHGVGTMYLHDGAAGGEGGSKPFEFVNGEPVERE